MSAEVEAAVIAELTARFWGISAGKLVSTDTGKTARYHSTVATVTEAVLTPHELENYPAILILDHISTEFAISGEHEYPARWMIALALWVRDGEQDVLTTQIPRLLRELEDDVVLSLHTDPTLGLPGVQVTVQRFDKVPPTDPTLGLSVCTLLVQFPFEAVR